MNFELAAWYRLKHDHAAMKLLCGIFCKGVPKDSIQNA